MSEKDSILDLKNNNSDCISGEIISRIMNDCRVPVPIVYEETDSTNRVAKELAKEGCKTYQSVIATAQSSGRGRLGRAFFSPKDTGLYISVVTRPKIKIEQSLFITTAAAVCMCEAVEECFGISLDIKWVNDLYKDGKKVCGILTEAAMLPGSTELDYAVVGIGINMYIPRDGFPEEISETASYLLDMPVADAKNHLVAQFLKQFKSCCENLENKNIRDNIARRYKELSFVIGKDIYIIQGEKKTPAAVLDIDKDCRLLVKHPDGTTDTVFFGEISIRLRH